MNPTRKPSAEAMPYLLGLIRAGTYSWVAARAAGVPDEEFRQFLRNPSPQRDEILQAEAQVCAKAEIDLKEQNPAAWLRYGPGRPTAHHAGWTAAVRAWDTADETTFIFQHLNKVALVVERFTGSHPEAATELSELIDVLEMEPSAD